MEIVHMCCIWYDYKKST